MENRLKFLLKYIDTILGYILFKFLNKKFCSFTNYYITIILGIQLIIKKAYITKGL